MKLQLTVNSKTYDVEIQESSRAGALKVNVDGSDFDVEVANENGMPEIFAAQPLAAPAPPPAPAAHAPASVPAPKPAAKPAAPPVDGTPVKSPMVGKILAVKTAEGAAVKAGDLLFLLEAMKMENEITSPTDGVVKMVAVSDGDTVRQGDVLCVLG